MEARRYHYESKAEQPSLFFDTEASVFMPNPSQISVKTLVNIYRTRRLYMWRKSAG